MAWSALSHCWVSRHSDVQGRKTRPPRPVLQEHQALGCLAVLVRAEQGRAVSASSPHHITVEVEGHGQALEGGVELQGSVAVGAASHSRR